ncbi:MAG: sodium:solute symporter [Candidatus Cyclobacteriaceae bacterium M2_1C_046]
MRTLDWIVLFGTLLFIVSYGVYKTRGSKDIEGYLLGDKSMKWWTIGLSIMATQASAITFLSTPGQAFEDGMRFIQFYLGLPIAMVILSITFVPIYYRLKVYTAYEFLENRFDLKTRSLTAFLFLVQRGLAAGITIYAPAIILSKMIGLSLTFTNLIIGTLVIIYTVIGGTKAVSVTQKQQMGVMMGGMILAGFLVISYLPEQVSFGGALNVAGAMGKLNVVDFDFDLSNRYNIWSGIIGGLFVALSYFGTDQSQVQRYLGGKNIKESRLGLMFNGLLKVPMQFLILFIGVMVFVFYQFYQPPVFYNEAAIEEVRNNPEANQKLEELNLAHYQAFEAKKNVVYQLAEQPDNEQLRDQANQLQREMGSINDQAALLVASVNPDLETNDTDYVFITFVMNHLPVGVVGLLLAVIFSAAMSSTSSELNALASTTTVDIYKRSVNSKGSDKHYLNASKLFTLMWGLIAIAFATFASLMDNLIEFVNILGSLFYGTILGVFLTAFYIKYIKGTPVFIAALLAEATVIYLFFNSEIGYLWFNVIGCFAVVILAMIIQVIRNR